MFVSVPQQSFTIDIMKSLLKKVQATVGSSVNVLPKYPYLNEQLKLPAVVLTRVSDETMVLARNSGFFGHNSTGETGASVERLEGYRYNSHYQLDVLGKSSSEMMSLSAQIQEMLFSPDGRSFGDEGFPGMWRQIPVLHFASATSTGSTTDLRMCYKFEDVTGIVVDSFDKQEVHQYSITIPFWCDYIKPRDVDKITSMSSNVIPHG